MEYKQSPCFTLAPIKVVHDERQWNGGTLVVP